jgi:hypothetical protein
MKIRIDRTRMAGLDRCYAYDAYVSVKECPQVDKYATTTHILNNARGEYYTYDVATRPAEHWQMEKGWERYQACLDNEKEAKVRILAIARTVYPELVDVAEWPTLWAHLPNLEASHDTRLVTV